MQEYLYLGKLLCESDRFVSHRRFVDRAEALHYDRRFHKKLSPRGGTDSGFSGTDVNYKFLECFMGLTTTGLCNIISSKWRSAATVWATRPAGE